MNEIKHLSISIKFFYAFWECYSHVSVSNTIIFHPTDIPKYKIIHYIKSKITLETMLLSQIGYLLFQIIKTIKICYIHNERMPSAH